LLLSNGLKGFSTDGLPIRTRSKVVKSKICEILGYPIPKKFEKTKPRFPGQNFDTYIQKSNNLQIWNEELEKDRRYVLIKEESGCLTSVKVLNGEQLEPYDTTGCLTQKYQASFKTNTSGGKLCSVEDTAQIASYVFPNDTGCYSVSETPVSDPEALKIHTISTIYEKLQNLIGYSFKDPGRNQERNRGEILHKAVCKILGFESYADNGQFPDIKNQLLEIKLQTSPTIDLGLVTPSDTSACPKLPKLGETFIRHCDIRYAIFDAAIENGMVIIRGVYLSTGENFFNHFPRFEGKVINKKIQIPLPRSLF
jgi:hypothetical protein